MATVDGSLADVISTHADGSDGRFVTFDGHSVELGGATAIYYKMMQPDSGAPGGYLVWVNTTGDQNGRPAPVGVLGDMMVVATWS